MGHITDEKSAVYLQWIYARNGLVLETTSFRNDKEEKNGPNKNLIYTRCHYVETDLMRQYQRIHSGDTEASNFTNFPPK